MSDTARNWVMAIVGAVAVALFLWWMSNTMYDLGRSDERTACGSRLIDSMNQMHREGNR